jgi:hypothetical protein
VPSVRYEDLPHERPDLEALLPDSLAGLPLLKCSEDGRFAVGNQDLYLGAFQAITDELVPPERRADNDFLGTQLDRLWVAIGHLERQGGGGIVQLFVLDDPEPNFWGNVLERLQRGVGEEYGAPMVWTREHVGGVELLRADLGGDDHRSIVLLGSHGLLELRLFRGPRDRDGEFAAAVAALAT